MNFLAVKIGFMLIMGQVNTQELNILIETAYRNNPGLSALKKIAQAEKSLVSSMASLDDPVIGVSNLNRNFNTQYGTISQKIRFPVKYYLQGKAQSSKADSRQAHVDMEKLNIRKQVISLYYSIYSIQKIIELTNANMQAVQDFARVAEKKYATGRSAQSDSMKAHFELTQLELDLIRLNQEEDALQEELKAIINDHRRKELILHKKELNTPDFDERKVSETLSDLNQDIRNNSPKLKKELHLLKAAEAKSTLSKWEFMPDFQFQYQQRIGGEPIDSKIYSVGITVPLWFWKKGSESSAASSYKIAQEYKVVSTSQKLIAQVKDLKGKVKAGAKTLKIYKTGLIPQAQSAYNSTRAAYRANKTSFLDLLDSERSLYRVKTGFYQSLKIYIKNITQLESLLGLQVSNLGDNHGS